MSIELIRIDDRLVHGQVVEGWVKYLHATKVTVVNDFVVNNHSRRMVMELALPEGVNFQAVSVDQFAERGDLNKGNKNNEREIVLFASPADVIQAITHGLNIKQINLGGMHHFNCVRCLTPNIALNEQDVKDLKCLIGMEINVNVCALPNEQGINLINLL